MNKIKTEELYKELNKPGVKIIDIRPVEAYNGWRLCGEKRGGHIEGAKSLPAKWADYIDWIEIVRSKGIENGDSLIIYGYDESETEKVAGLFKKTGYDNVRVYRDFLDEWIKDEKLPMERLKRYKNLISAGWLKELIEKGDAPEYENDKYIVCHAHYRNPGDYQKGHIPGAIDIDTNVLEEPKSWNRRNPQEIEKALIDRGITADTTVILYGRFSYPDSSDPFPGSSAGQLGAMRAALIMLYAGVKDIRILNGGLQSWLDKGFSTSSDEVKKEPIKDFGLNIPARPEYFINMQEAKNYLQSPDKNLVSVRSWPEYTGEVSGYNYIEKKGRIPGSVFGNCGSDAYHMENYRNLDHTMREYHEVEEIWKKAGITPDKKNAFYCGTGWRGSEAFFNAWFMGWPDISVFDGGWYQWSMEEGDNYETGVPE